MKDRNFKETEGKKPTSQNGVANPPKIDLITGDTTIERERAKWVAKQRKDHLEFVRQFSFHTSRTFMDYLHGDVAEGETWFACLYEYARESKNLREASNRRDELKSKGLDSEKAALSAVEEMAKRPIFLSQVLTFLECESFPKRDWNELSPGERTGITRLNPTKTIPPLHMTDLWTLKAIGVLDKFKAMAEEAKPVIEDVPPGTKAKPMKLVLPMLQQHESHHHAIFALDFSEAETHLVKRFGEWLKLPDNQQRLKQYAKPRRGTTGKSLDRLKDLAAWRLYRESGNELNAANDFANSNRKQRKPFRDAKPKKENLASGKGKITPANDVDLFCDNAEAGDAQAGAWKFLVEIMPEEFAPQGKAYSPRSWR